MMGRFDGSGRGGRGGGRGYPNAGGGRDVSGVSPNSYAAQSAAEKEAALMPFLHPTPRVLVPVPLVFESPQHFCELIANNLLAEFWYLIQEGPRGPGLKATPSAGGGLRVGGDTAGDGDASLVHHLLLIDRRLHVVVQQTQGGVVNTGTGDKTPCVLTLKPKLAGPFVGPIRSFGYVGAFVAELSALRELSLRDNNGDAASPALRAMLSPNTAVLGNWHPPPLPEEDFALIAASRGAVKHSVGTTKKDKTSRGKVGLGASVVTRVTQHEIKNPNGTDVHAVAPGVDAVIAGADAKDANCAHDSDDDLLEKETPDDSRVTQPKTRKGVGANASQRAAVCALKWALEKIQGPPGTGKSTTIYHVITQRVPPGQRVLVTCSRNVAIESIAQKLETCSSEILVVGAPGRIGATARKYLLDAKTEAHPKVRALAASSPGGFQSPAAMAAANAVKGELMMGCRLILCTIASVSRLLREWEEHASGNPLVVHTVIVDECGCTPESSTALLLNLRPENVVLLGDHHQLPPCSLINPRDLQNTGHDRSALERCVLGSEKVSVSVSENYATEKPTTACHRLTEQYRMHPEICALISNLFYGGTLTTAPSIATERVGYFLKLREKEDLEKEVGDVSSVSVSDAAETFTENLSVTETNETESVGSKNIPPPKNLQANCNLASSHVSTRAMVWVQVNGAEQQGEGGKSYVNRLEVVAVVAAARRLRERHGEKATIAALTFYKGQYLCLMDAMPSSLKVDCLTVDACQGSEFDFVLISTVRANDRRAVGFVADSRRINVAISRSKRSCVVLGDARTMAGRPGTDWHGVLTHSHREGFGNSRDRCRWFAEPEPPGFESVMARKRVLAKLPVESDDKKQEEALGVNVGAAAFVPKAARVLSKQQIDSDKKKAKKKASKAAKKDLEKQNAAFAAQTQMGAYPSFGVPLGVSGAPESFGRVPQYSQLQYGQPSMMPNQMMPTQMMPQNLVVFAQSTTQAPPRQMTPRTMTAPPAMHQPPPMHQSSMHQPPPAPPPPQGFPIPSAFATRRDAVPDDDDWEPPSGRLRFALNLTELGALRSSDSVGSFDLQTDMPEWNGGEIPQNQNPPAFSFGNKW